MNKDVKNIEKYLARGKDIGAIHQIEYHQIMGRLIRHGKSKEKVRREVKKLCIFSDKEKEIILKRL